MSNPFTLRAESLTRQAADKRAAASLLAGKESPTAEDTAAFDALLAEATALDGEAKAATARATALDANDATLSAYKAPAPRKTGDTAHAPAVVREAVLDDPKRGFRDLADFALAIKDAGPSLGSIQSDPRLRAAAGTGMVQGVTMDGGVLTPPAFSTQVWDGARMASNSLLQYCDVQTIDAAVQSLTIPAIDETDRADGSRWGAVRGYWKNELTEISNGSRPKFREITVTPKEMYVLGYISDKLLRSAPGLASNLLGAAAADEINFKVGDSIINGDGAGKPTGVVGHAATVSVSKETGQAAATIVKANIDKMWARCHANWRNGAVWFINQSVEPELENLSAVVGTGGVPVYLPAGGVADTPNARLKGRPVIPIEYCAALGTVGDIVLANLGAYLVGMRGMVDSAVSMHLKFDFAQSCFRWIFEIDGQPWLRTVITPFKDTTKTLSPVVTLATRS